MNALVQDEKGDRCPGDFNELHGLTGRGLGLVFPVEEGGRSDVVAMADSHYPIKLYFSSHNSAIILA